MSTVDQRSYDNGVGRRRQETNGAEEKGKKREGNSYLTCRGRDWPQNNPRKVHSSVAMPLKAYIMV
jgi:hypothetical protein